MCCEDKKCASWISLESIGINKHGCLHNSSWLNSLVIPSNQSIFNSSLYIDLPNEKLLLNRTVASGKFGCIDLASYNTQSKYIDVYVKRPIIQGKSLLYEACIQKLVGDSLNNIGFPTGAPPLVRIFKLNDGSICFAMEQISNSITLDKYLESASTNIFTSVIIDCILQVCAMTWYLDTKLGINHRDLKPSNFLISESDTTKRKIIVIDTEILELETTKSLTFIDFGFSCLGSTETNISNISLSNVYSRSDPCPKEGRDMYLFLAFIYIDYYSKLPSQLLKLFESWLNIPGYNLCNIMLKDKESAKKWLYFIVGNEKITHFICCPSRIVKDLQAFI